MEPLFWRGGVHYLAENLGAPHFVNFYPPAMPVKLLHCLVVTSFIMTLIFIAVSKIIVNHQWMTECTADQDCLGELSTCNNGMCHCDVYYFHPVLRCDIHAPTPIEPFGIVAMVFFFIFISLGCAAAIEYDKNNN